ncbi:formyltetrahydrofolate deformylase [Gilvimarinus sp. SDUM040013]|uniref:Formyltetrahydrofolate deformylase n=1 Tax=Gilvimarinus gilvus TaxID=3058038 RepID=A0ABU4RTH1_9GAMM|nr:formyltetrahydrofolate deformylase [Gilvimarinus sp. SDUM040013]MDO3386921.1 formyltetrahydrofolate deformylase [Gilvimarinus sp. SDUM040013]MDX6848185.1 formyltetrahydrofolate deformylase [Gilvimarinus sp. SDUM040013]
MAGVREIILTFSCQDSLGLVARVATVFAERGFNITESSQFEDTSAKRFFMRTVFDCPDNVSMTEIEALFEPVAIDYSMDWQISDTACKPKVLIAVSQWGHCLSSLLNSWKVGSLPIDIVGVVSNHEVMRPLTEWYELPFHYLPVTPDTKPEQEAAIWSLMQTTDADCLVLARYMQILSDDLCQKLSGRAINIHHSFLPGFKGAKPYHQAYERGVKLIGATAHFVTADLDEGPIIEQAVERVSHVNAPEQMAEIGRDIEAVVLNRALRWHAEHRVLLNGTKTVVFSR